MSLTLLGQANAESPPAEFRDLIEFSKNRSVTIKEIDEKLAPIVWRDTTKDADGLLIVQRKPEFLKIIDEFRQRLAITNHSPGDICDVRTRRIGRLDESINRKSVLLELIEHRTQALVTVWNFQLDGAKIVLFSDFLNSNFDGIRGTLSIAIAKEVPHQTIWKATWIERELQYEVYIHDALATDGRPIMAKADVLEFTMLSARSKCLD